MHRSVAGATERPYTIRPAPVRGWVRVRLGRLAKQCAAHRTLLLIFAPGLLYFLVFNYIPMIGIVLAFKDYHVRAGIWNSPWAGLTNFGRFFASYYAGRIIINAILLNVLSLIIAFPMPILLALLLNEVRSNRYKRSVQTITYFPHFVSAVIMVGMVKMLLSPDPSVGIVNQIRMSLFHAQAVDFATEPELFRPVYILMLIWQGTGFSAIIYLASLAAVDVQIYEAALIDGANRLELARHINLPALAPTIVVLLLLNISGLLRSGVETILAFYSPAIYSTADVIETFVYRRGLAGDGNLPPDYSFATAVGLFQSVVGLILIVGANRLARRITGHSLW